MKQGEGFVQVWHRCPRKMLCLISTVKRWQKTPLDHQRDFWNITLMFLEKKLGHEPKCLCFLALLKGFVFFFSIIIDCFWERLTSLQIIPWFWVALLSHIKTSRKHFPLWCSHCLLSEAIPSEGRSYFACSWFSDVEHAQPPQLVTQANLDYLLCKVHSRFNYFLYQLSLPLISLFACKAAARLKHHPHDAGSSLVFTDHIKMPKASSNLPAQSPSRPRLHIPLHTQHCKTHHGMVAEFQVDTACVIWSSVYQKTQETIYQLLCIIPQPIPEILIQHSLFKWNIGINWELAVWKV